MLLKCDTVLLIKIGKDHFRQFLNLSEDMGTQEAYSFNGGTLELLPNAMFDQQISGAVRDMPEFLPQVNITGHTGPKLCMSL